MLKHSFLPFIASCLAFLALGATATTAQTPCVAPVAWTSHAAVLPPDNATAPTSNCAFHVWSWNTFLWMTQPSGAGTLRFETFATIDELFADNAALTSFAALPTQKTLMLTVRDNKTAEMSNIDSINQAGTNGVIVHGPDKTQGRALYYSQNIDPTFYEFVRSNQYYIPATYAAASPTQNFPVGAMEFKYSWKIVDAADDASKFYTVPAEIFLLKETVDSDGKTIIAPDPDSTANVTVALVGVHVVGVVQDHPEFIWATFEHVDNAPDLGDIPLSSSDPVSDRDWTFYHANTSANEANKNPIATLKLDPATQMLSPTVDVVRVWAYGGGDPSNVDNLKSLNASVQSGVVAGTVWENYFMVGSVWGAPNSLMPDSSVNPQIGSTSLANATMETFDQFSFAGSNCLGCHNTRGETKNDITLPPLNMNISHIMRNGFYTQSLAGK